VSYIKVELQQGTPEWHAFRLEGLGGSDAPVVEGNSPYRTKLQLFREKRGLPSLAEEDNSKEFIFALGHKTEALIREQFFELTGVYMNPMCAIHEKYAHVRASLDGFDSKKYGVMEAKLVGQAVLSRAREEGKIPDHHFTQIQHQCEVTGADVGHWFGHDGKKNGILITVPADREYIARLLEKEHSFWEDVKAGQVPELSPKDYLVPEDDSLLRQLRDAKELAENAQAHYDSLKEKVISTYKHSRIAGAGIKLFQVERQGSVNYKSIPELKSLSEEYLDQFRGKGSTSWTIRLEGV
jgi:putative phage-type endonuclease